MSSELEIRCPYWLPELVEGKDTVEIKKSEQPWKTVSLVKELQLRLISVVPFQDVTLRACLHCRALHGVSA